MWNSYWFGAFLSVAVFDIYYAIHLDSWWSLAYGAAAVVMLSSALESLIDYLSYRFDKWAMKVSVTSQER